MSLALKMQNQRPAKRSGGEDIPIVAREALGVCVGAQPPEVQEAPRSGQAPFGLIPRCLIHLEFFDNYWTRASQIPELVLDRPAAFQDQGKVITRL